MCSNDLMRVALVIGVVIVAGCSSEPVQQIGFRQYLVTASGEKAFAKATETCNKQDRKWTVLANPPGSAAGQFRFECVNSYEIVPSDADTYRVRVFTPDIPLRHVTIPATQDRPADTQWVYDTEPVEQDATQRASDFCAKTNKAIRVTAQGFVTDPGLEIVFKCVPR
jgi:hypothetical protein